jgi:hypothetical protein
MSVEVSGRIADSRAVDDIGYRACVAELLFADDGTGDSDPVAVFRARLQQLRAECGAPSIRDVDRPSRRVGRPQSRSVIQAKLTGRTTPDRVFVEMFVEACGRHAGNGRDPGLPVWRERHAGTLVALAEQRRPVPVCPYRGLEAFTGQEAVWFHGRGGTVDQVLAAQWPAVS